MYFPSVHICLLHKYRWWISTLQVFFYPRQKTDFAFCRHKKSYTDHRILNAWCFSEDFQSIWRQSTNNEISFGYIDITPCIGKIHEFYMMCTLYIKYNRLFFSYFKYKKIFVHWRERERGWRYLFNILTVQCETWILSTSVDCTSV